MDRALQFHSVVDLPKAKSLGRCRVLPWLRFRIRHGARQWRAEVVTVAAHAPKHRGPHAIAVQFATAYARWSIEHTDRCPKSIYELLPHMTSRKNVLDRWGRPFVMLCGDMAPPASGGFGIASAGPDRDYGTDDDIKSWERRR